MNSSLAWLCAFGAAAAASLLMENGPINALAIGVLGAGLFLLRRAGFPPVLVFVFGYQWVQASTTLFEASFSAATVNEYVDFVGDVGRATALSLAALGALAAGMVQGLRRRGRRRPGPEPALLHVDDKPAMFWLWCYLGAIAAALVLQALSGPVAGLRQPLLAASALRWAFFSLFTTAAFRRGGRARVIWLATFLGELGMGTVGYFSDFKLVLFFTAFGLMSAGWRMTARRVLGLAAMGAFTVFLAVGWTAVKVEQRRFLSGGEKMQASTASTAEALENLFELASDVDAAAMAEAAQSLAERVAYVEYFGRVLDMVPSTVPYEQGEIWLDAITRPLMPRLLFPDKPEIDDTERTIYYAGLPVGPFYAATSISLGYMAETYIDFGPWLMFVPIFALGWILGRFYRYMATHPRAGGDVGVALASAVLFQAAYLESSITKLWGSLILGMLAAWLMARYVIPRLLPQRPSPSRDLTVSP